MAMYYPKQYVWLCTNEKEENKQPKNDEMIVTEGRPQSGGPVKKAVDVFLYASSVNGFWFHFSLNEKREKSVFGHLGQACFIIFHAFIVFCMISLTIKEFYALIYWWRINSYSSQVLIVFNMNALRELGTFAYFFLLFRYRKIRQLLSRLISSIEERLREDHELFSNLKFWSRFGAALLTSLLVFIVTTSFNGTNETSCKIESIMPHLKTHCDGDLIALLLINLDFILTTYRLLLINTLTILYCFCVYLLFLRIDMCVSEWRGCCMEDRLWDFQEQHKAQCFLLQDINACFSPFLMVFVTGGIMDITLFVRCAGYSSDELMIDPNWCYFSIVAMANLLLAQVLFSAKCNSQISKIIPKAYSKLRMEKSLQFLFHSNSTNAMTLNFHTYTTLFMLNPSSITALGYFELNKTVLAAIAGTILTYSLMLYGIN